jgi:CO/xanthine dehydrogenase Mo-binding subunit
MFPYATAMTDPDALVGMTIRSTVARGRIVGIDTAAALAVPGAVAVFSAVDLPGRRLGQKTADQPVFADGEIRHFGEPVAFVVAETQDAAARMSERTVVDVEPLAPLVDPLTALEPSAPAVGPAGNLVHRLELAHGDGRPGEVVVRRRWRTGRQDAAFLAPEAGLARPDGRGGVVLTVATQDVHADRDQICRALGLPADRVRVELGGVGGAFGGREDITVHVHLCLAVLRLGRPVLVRYSRAESLAAHPSRHPAVIDVQLTATRDGRFVSLDTVTCLDGGAYASTSMPITKIAHYFAGGPYRFDSIRVDTRAVYTNNPPAGALRGFGATQACFGVESTVDVMAQTLGMDPLELRRRNLIRVGEPLATSHQPLAGTAEPAAVLDACAAVPLPIDPVPAGRIRGVGYAVGAKSAGLGDGRSDPATVRLVAETRGIRIDSAAAEVGQGIGEVLLRIVGSAFPGIELTLATAETDLPVAGGSKASRQTMASGGAAVLACRKLQDRLADRAGHTWVEQLSEGPVTVSGCYDGPATVSAGDDGTGHVHKTIQLAAHRAVVDVDPELGEIRLVQLVGAQDVGRAIDPVAVRGQLIGGAVQGAGFALTEQRTIDAQGRQTTTGFGDYLFPGAIDVPEVVAVMVTSDDPSLLTGGRGIGEGPLVSSPAAVAAAVRAATGASVESIPIGALRCR